MMRLCKRLATLFAVLPGRRRSFDRLGVLSLLFMAGSGATSFAGFLPTITLADAGANFNPATYPPTYGTITINRTSNNTIDVTLTADPGSHNGYHYLFGDGGTIALNLTGSNLTASAISYSSPFSGTQNVTQGSAGNQDGFGNFTFSMNTQGGAGNALSSLSFTVTASGSPWTSDAAVLGLNDDNKVASAHLFTYLGPPSDTNNTANLTAFVADGDRSTAAPEPATIVTLATALPIGLLALRRRLRGNPATA